MKGIRIKTPVNSSRQITAAILYIQDNGFLSLIVYFHFSIHLI